MGYEYLREQYPEIISKDQLYRICHISKRKARWLLENGIIPCEDSGKQTRRFRIRLEGVITFLERRDAGLLQAEIPVGIFSSGVHSSAQPRQTLDSGALCAFLLERWADAPDMLTAQQAASLCGYGPAAINGWIGKGRMTALPCRGRNLIRINFVKGILEISSCRFPNHLKMSLVIFSLIWYAYHIFGRKRGQ